jgi:hypothetical protein
VAKSRKAVSSISKHGLAVRNCEDKFVLCPPPRNCKGSGFEENSDACFVMTNDDAVETTG